MSEQEGHKDTYIKTVVSYVRSLHNVFNLWNLQVLFSAQLASPMACGQQRLLVTGKQMPVLAYIKHALSSRLEHYSSIALVPGEERSKEVQMHDENDNANEAPGEVHNSTVDWTGCSS